MMVTAPENVKDMLIINEEQAALYSGEIRGGVEQVPARDEPPAPRAQDVCRRASAFGHAIA